MPKFTCFHLNKSAVSFLYLKFLTCFKVVPEGGPRKIDLNEMTHNFQYIYVHE